MRHQGGTCTCKKCSRKRLRGNDEMQTKNATVDSTCVEMVQNNVAKECHSSKDDFIDNNQNIVPVDQNFRPEYSNPRLVISTISHYI